MAATTSYYSHSSTLVPWYFIFAVQYNNVTASDLIWSVADGDDDDDDSVLLAWAAVISAEYST